MPKNKLSFADRLAHGWNAFRNKDPVEAYTKPAYDPVIGPTVSYLDSIGKPRRITPGIDQTIAPAIYTRLSTDAAQATIGHVRVDENDNFLETIRSGLNEVLTVSANCDQTGRAFIQDLIYSMLDEGVGIGVPIETDVNPETGSFDITNMRVGRAVDWYPQHVRVEVYNEWTGQKEQIKLAKKSLAIVQNPFFDVMNTPNSTLKRLTHKLALLDVIDEQSAAGKLDLIIQLPYTIKSESRKKQAEQRRSQIETQLAGSKYGIAYIDGTERVTQLNRAVENNLMTQIEFLTRMLYSQLGLTDEIMNGTASEEAMVNYYKRTSDVLVTAVVEEFERKFLTKTARTRQQRIQFHRNPFNLTTTEAMAEVADKFTRNEILAPNEIRGIVGFKPSADPNADELRNRNISQSNEAARAQAAGLDEMGYEEYDPAYQNEGVE